MLVKLDQGLLLLFLHLEQRFRLFLQLTENALLVLLFVLQRHDLLNVVAALELSAHVLDLSLVELSLGLGLLELSFLKQDLLVFLGEFVPGYAEHLLVLALPALLNERFKLAGEHFQLSLEFVVLGAQLGDHDLFFVPGHCLIIRRQLLLDRLCRLDRHSLNLLLNDRNDSRPHIIFSLSRVPSSTSVQHFTVLLLFHFPLTFFLQPISNL